MSATRLIRPNSSGLFLRPEGDGFKRSVAITPFVINARDTIPLPKELLSGDFGLVTAGAEQMHPLGCFPNGGTGQFDWGQILVGSTNATQFWYQRGRGQQQCTVRPKSRSAQVGFYAGFRLEVAGRLSV